MKKPKQRQVMELAKDRPVNLSRSLDTHAGGANAPALTTHNMVRWEADKGHTEGADGGPAEGVSHTGLSLLHEWRLRVQLGKEAQFGLNTKFHPGCLWLNTLLKINLFIKYLTPLQLPGIVLGPGALAGRKLRNFCPHGKLEKYMLIPEPLIHFLTLKFSSSVYWNQLSNKIGIKISRS